MDSTVRDNVSLRVPRDIADRLAELAGPYRSRSSLACELLDETISRREHDEKAASR